MPSSGRRSSGEEAAPSRRTVRTASGQPFVINSRPMIELMEIVDRVAAGLGLDPHPGRDGHRQDPDRARGPRRQPARRPAVRGDQLRGHPRSSCIESELFGHEKGAFTGAGCRQTGRSSSRRRRHALPRRDRRDVAAVQAKLLRVLEDGELRRVGGTATRKVDVRVIAATNKDLKAEVEAKRFREDLLFRLNVIHPPGAAAARAPRGHPAAGRPLPRALPAARSGRASASPRRPREPLMAYDWPGNVRELGNAVERLILLAPGEEHPGRGPAAEPTAGDAAESRRLGHPAADVRDRTPPHHLCALRFTEGKKGTRRPAAQDRCQDPEATRCQAGLLVSRAAAGLEQFPQRGLPLAAEALLIAPGDSAADGAGRSSRWAAICSRPCTRRWPGWAARRWWATTTALGGQPRRPLVDLRQRRRLVASGGSPTRKPGRERRPRRSSGCGHRHRGEPGRPLAGDWWPGRQGAAARPA